MIANAAQKLGCSKLGNFDPLLRRQLLDYAFQLPPIVLNNCLRTCTDYFTNMPVFDEGL